MDRARDAEPRQLGLLDGDGADPLGIRVRESARARRLGIRVHPWGQVEVVVPRGVSPGRVRRFVHDNRDWIARARRRMDLPGARPVTGMPGDLTLALTGERFDVGWQARDGSPGVRERRETLVVSGSEDEALAALRRWLLDRGRRVLAPMLEEASARTGLAYRRLQVRRQRTRWGSCSSSGTISLNACLLFLEPDQARYLLVHELCHTRHMNHSRAFWRLVESHEPDARRLDRSVGAAWRRIPGWVMADRLR